MRNRGIIIAVLAIATAFAALAIQTRAQSQDVARATLANGLRVIVVRNTLAPVVSVMLNYEVGSDEQWIPGLAHATEHMMFRGSRTLSSSQLMDAIDITGGNLDADTQATVTQYAFTVPSQYLDIALRAERSRATGLLMSQNLWQQERGAITQEVQQDNSNAIYRVFVKMQSRLIGGTPYDKNTLGTVADFANNVDSAQLLKFYHQWYHPNNAIYVIVGDVDPAATVARVKQLFGDVPAAKLPARAPVRLAPLRTATYHDSSDLPFTFALLGYRFPGYDSPDFAAGKILGDVLSSQRSAFGGLAFTNKGVLASQFFAQPFPRVSMALAAVAVPVSTPPEAADRELRAIIAGYQKTGLPPDLVESAKLRAISELEFSANSIPGQAQEWSQAVAIQRLLSPDDMIAQYREGDRRRRQPRAAYLPRQPTRRRRICGSKERRRREHGRGNGEREQPNSADLARAAAGLGAASTRASARARADARANGYDALERHSLDRSAPEYLADRRRGGRNSKQPASARAAESRGCRRCDGRDDAVRHDDIRSSRISSRARQDRGDDQSGHRFWLERPLLALRSGRAALGRPGTAPGVQCRRLCYREATSRGRANG